MRNEVISAGRNAQGQLEVETLWLLTDAEVAQLSRAGLVRQQADRNVLTQVHHILSPSRASGRGQRIITDASGNMLHASGDYLPPDIAENDPRLWTWRSSGLALDTWVRTRGNVSVPAFGFVPTLYHDVRGAPLEYLDPQWQRETFVRDPNDEVAVVADWKGGLLDRQLTRSEPIEERQRTTLNLQVGAGADDAYEGADDAGFDGTGTFVSHIDSATAANVDIGGHRFTSATASGTINSATWGIICLTTSHDDPQISIGCQDVDAAPNFTTDSDVTNRVRTTSLVNWDANGIGVARVQSPDISTPVQDVIDRGSYGDVLCVVAQGLNLSSSLFVTKSYENDSASAATLDIDYTAGGGAANPKGVLGMPLHGPFGGPI